MQSILGKILQKKAQNCYVIFFWYHEFYQINIQLKLYNTVFVPNVCKLYTFCSEVKGVSINNIRVVQIIGFTKIKHF